MSVNRRSLLVSPLLAALVAAVPDVIKSAMAASIDPAQPPRAPMFPRGVIVTRADSYETDTFQSAARAGLIRSPTINLISNGRELVPLESDEGQAIARETAVNLRSDGTLRHRQHHWPR